MPWEMPCLLFFVFNGKRNNPELMKGATTGAEGVMSESLWSNSEVFKQYLQDHFLPYVRTQASSSEPILLIFDGHASQVSTSLIEWANFICFACSYIPSTSTFRCCYI